MKVESTEQQVFPEIYANLSQCSASASDISITLGLSGTAPLGAVQNNPPKPVALVRLSPPSARMLLLGLQQMLRVYEKRFGAISIPKEFQEALLQGDIQLGLASDTKGTS